VHNPSPVPSAKPSLADFLTGDTTTSEQDFRWIAAKLYGDATAATKQKSQINPNDSTSAAEIASSVAKNKSENLKSIDKSKDDAAKAPSESQAVPNSVVLIAPPLVQPVPKSQDDADEIGLQKLNTKFEDAVPLHDLGGAEAAERGRDKATASDKTAGKDARPDPGKNEDASGQMPTVNAGIQLAQTLAQPAAPPPGVEVKGKKEPASSKPVEDSLHSHVPTASRTVQQPGVALTSEQTSVPSLKEILDATKTLKGAPQPQVASPVLISKDGVAQSTAGNKKTNERGEKDTPHTGVSSIGKQGSIQAGLVPGVTAASGTGTSKDGGAISLSTPAVTSPAAGHGKTVLLKETGTPLSANDRADLDAPDESRPTDAASLVTTAKLVQGMSQSEFRVGMQSSEFGNIDIRTSVARHLFSAQISVERGDMAKSMTAELPALYHKLADQQVPVASITIQGQNLATSSGLPQDTQRQAWQPQGQGSAKLSTETVMPVVAETLSSPGRLDIRI